MRSLFLLLFLTIAFFFTRGQTPAIDSMRQSLQQAQADSQRLQTLAALSKAWLFRQPDSARVYAEQLLVEAQAAGAKQAMGMAHNTLATTEAMAGQLRQALSRFRHAGSYFKALGLSLEYGSTLHNQGNCYQRLDRNDSAMHYFLDGLRTFAAIPDSNRIAGSHNAVGEILKMQGRYEEARFHYERALDIRKRLGQEAFLTHSYNRLGNLALEQENWTEARQHYQQYLNLARKYDKSLDIATALSNLGNVHYGLGRYDSALQAYLASKSAYEAENQPYYLAFIHNNLAKTYLGLNQPEAAITATRQARSFAQAAKALSLETEAYEHLSRAYALQGDYQQALQAMQTFKQLSDSLQAQHNQQEVSKLAAQYDHDRLLQDNQIKDLRIRQQDGAFWLAIAISSAVVLLILIAFLIIRQGLQSRKQQAELALQRKEQEAQQLKELDQFKSRFFANISHEFRTPLTLIKGPVQTLQQTLNDPEIQSQLTLIQGQAQQLQTLIDQVLALAKLEAQQMPIREQVGDVVKFLHQQAQAFAPLAAQNNIRFHSPEPSPAWMGRFDAEKWSSILQNLLSNAFKYTPEGGQVSWEYHLPELKTENPHLRLLVSDTGPGLSPEAQAQVFDRFFRGQNQQESGTGIGLALTRELVQLLGGKIEVKSQVGEGSHFLVSLPLEAAPAIQVSPADPLAETPAPQALESGLPLVLVVEDHAEMRQFLVGQLSDSYQCLEAADGNQGLELAQVHIPELVITDIMMPGMNGQELVQALRIDELTSHIPIIMLTALSAQTHKLEGLAQGVDAYLTKPFDAAELRLRVGQLIQQRQQLRARFSRSVHLEPKEIAFTSADERFLQKVMQVIEQEMGNESLSIEGLADSVAISRSQLHRKIKALTDQSPSMLIRSLRLKRAHQMLRQQVGTAAEISYQVGFSSPAYFSKCFKDQFGQTPSEVAEKADS